MKTTLTITLTFGLILLCACDLESGPAGDPEKDTTPSESAIAVECDVDLGLTPEAGVKIDWMDRERAWTVVVDGGAITLSRLSSCGDECTLTEEIVLTSADGGCPALVSARTVLYESMTWQGDGETETRATTGTLAIQDWDLETGVFSGRLTGELEMTFYATLED
jgi:hypothetical protein